MLFTTPGRYWSQFTSTWKNLSRPATMGATVNAKRRMWNAWRDGLAALSPSTVPASESGSVWVVAMGAASFLGDVRERWRREPMSPGVVPGDPGSFLKLMHLMFRFAARFGSSLPESDRLL